MCVIIARPKTVLIPPKIIEYAVNRNSEGWGLAIADRGKLEIQRGYDDKGTNPDVINRLLEETKHLNVLLHLRLRSSGEKGLENCHPFVVLNKKDHDYDLVFCHNGTMQYYNKDRLQKECDSYIFTQRILKDMCEKYLDLGFDPITDPTIREVLELAANDTNRFALINGDGQYLIINKEKGGTYYNSKDERGNVPENQWWASNDWSLKEPFTHHHGGQEDRPFHKDGMWAKWERERDEKKKEEKKKSAEKETQTTALIPWRGSSNNSTENGKQDQSNNFGMLFKANPIVSVPFVGSARSTFLENVKWEAHYMADKVLEVVNNTDAPSVDFINNLLSKRQCFTELCGIGNLFEVTCMDEDDIMEMINYTPELATILIMDLLTELYSKRMEDKAFRDKVAAAQWNKMNKKQLETQELLTQARAATTPKPADVANDTPVAM